MFNKRLFNEENINKLTPFLEYLFRMKKIYTVSYWSKGDKIAVVVKHGE